jgi:excisionase family DNA binding protein
MAEIQKTFSVSQAAALCGVGRTTVGYWIRSKKLHATRVGRNFTISIEDLLFFLQNSGQRIPPELLDQHCNKPFFKSFQNCWQYWQDTEHGTSCSSCIVFKKQLQECFTFRSSEVQGCSDCCNCRYYQETYLRRIQFVHQINLPAAVFKDLYLWGGNSHCAEICGVRQNDLVGMGIEKIIHAKSLPKVIKAIRKLALGEPAVKEACSITIKRGVEWHHNLRLSVYPLREPATVFLVLGVPLHSRLQHSAIQPL